MIYHVNHANMSNEEGVSEEARKLIDSLPAEGLTELSVGQYLPDIATLAALYTAEISREKIMSLDELFMMLVMAFYLGRETVKEEIRAEELLRGVNLNV